MSILLNDIEYGVLMAPAVCVCVLKKLPYEPVAVFPYTPPPPVELTVTCPKPFVGDKVMFDPASNRVTPPFKAYEAVVVVPHVTH